MSAFWTNTKFKMSLHVLACIYRGGWYFRVFFILYKCHGRSQRGDSPEIWINNVCNFLPLATKDLIFPWLTSTTCFSDRTTPIPRETRTSLCATASSFRVGYTCGRVHRENEHQRSEALTINEIRYDLRSIDSPRRAGKSRLRVSGASRLLPPHPVVTYARVSCGLIFSSTCVIHAWTESEECGRGTLWHNAEVFVGDICR